MAETVTEPGTPFPDAAGVAPAPLGTAASPPGDGGRRERIERESLVHIDALYRTAYRLSRSAQDAEDLVQETYLSAFRALDRFEEGTNLRAWLFRILNNAFITQYRKRKRRPTRSIDQTEEFFLYDHLSPDAPQRGENVERAALTRLSDETIRQKLDELPVDYRQVILLADVEDFSYREIADILSIPIGTVMSRLHRGRRRLQRLLVDEARAAGYPVPEDAAPATPTTLGTPSDGGGDVVPTRRFGTAPTLERTAGDQHNGAGAGSGNRMGVDRAGGE